MQRSDKINVFEDWLFWKAAEVVKDRSSHKQCAVSKDYPMPPERSTPAIEPQHRAMAIEPEPEAAGIYAVIRKGLPNDLQSARGQNRVSV